MSFVINFLPGRRDRNRRRDNEARKQKAKNIVGESIEAIAIKKWLRHVRDTESLREEVILEGHEHRGGLRVVLTRSSNGTETYIGLRLGDPPFACSVVPDAAIVCTFLYVCVGVSFFLVRTFHHRMLRERIFFPYTSSPSRTPFLHLNVG